MGSANDFIPFIPSEASYACIHYNHQKLTTYHQIVDELYQYLIKLSTRYTIHLLGYSMGGRIAYSLYSIAHDYLQSTYLISSGIPIYSPKERYFKQQFELLAIDQASKLPPIEFCTWWYSLPIYATLSSHPNFQQLITKRANLFNLNHFIKCIQLLSVLHMPLTDSDIKNSSSKLTYIYGENDKKYKKVASILQDKIDHINIVHLKNTGHLCWFESSIKSYLK